MTSTLADGASAVEHDDVRNAMKILAQHGLGVCVPHMHTDDDRMTTLAEDLVQFESDLQVSFVGRNDQLLDDAVPVAWTWDNGVRVTAFCRQGHGGTVPPPASESR